MGPLSPGSPYHPLNFTQEDPWYLKDTWIIRKRPVTNCLGCVDFQGILFIDLKAAWKKNPPEMGGKPDVGIGFWRNMFFFARCYVDKNPWGIFIIPLSLVFQSYNPESFKCSAGMFFGVQIPTSKPFWCLEALVCEPVFFHSPRNPKQDPPKKPEYLIALAT